jgi:hypothetical protein
MGNAETLRGRLTPAVVVAVLLALAAAVTLGVLARPAAAQATFTQCSSCHNYSYNDAYHTAPGHAAAASCSTCHVNGSGASGLVPSACVTCHTPTSSVLAKTTHASTGCGTTEGCHGYSTQPVRVTTLLSAKVAPTAVKVGKKAVVSGTAGPLPALASAKIALKVERKVGTKWVKMKTASATAGVTGAYKWSYKATKKGSHRVTVSIAQTTAFTAKKLVKTFKVK